MVTDANRTRLLRPFRASMVIPYSQGGATRLAPRSSPWADMLRPLRGNRSRPNRNWGQSTREVSVTALP